MSENVLELKGFLLTVYCPSEESLAITVDLSQLAPAMHLRLIHELQDILAEMDIEYARREPRVRTLQARYKRLITRRERNIRFYPVPNYFVNKVRHIRAEVYENINMFCIKIQRFVRGGFERNLYLLAEDHAPVFIAEIEKLNEEIEELNEEIARVDKTPIINLFFRYGIEIDPFPGLEVPKIDVQLLPIRIDPEIVKEWVEKSEIVARYLQDYRMYMIRKAIDDIKERLTPIIRYFQGEIKIKKAKKRLKELKELAESVGLKALADSVIVPLIEACDDPEKLPEPAPVFVESRISSLLEGL